jgi:F-type H+-transporting ATPase subunit alpha
VSRIGGKAQHPAIKTASAHIRLDYLQFLELELFARFGSRMEAGVEEKLHRGRLLREILKQDRLQPLSEQAHLAWLLAYGEGLLENTNPAQVATVLEKILKQLPLIELKLDTPKQQWLTALKQLLADES